MALDDIVHYGVFLELGVQNQNLSESGINIANADWTFNRVLGFFD